MVDFVYARACRQQTILIYFGEPEPERCGIAIFAPTTPATAAAPGTRRGNAARAQGAQRRRPDEQQDGEGWVGRFGKGRIVQTLLGSRSREVIDANLDQLSTYGLLREEGISYLNELFRELQASGLVSAVAPREFQRQGIPDDDADARRGQGDARSGWVRVILARTGSGHASGEENGRAQPGRSSRRWRWWRGAENAPLDADLFVALKQKRDQIARDAGNLPRYVIFPDETLKASGAAQAPDGGSRASDPGSGRVEGREVSAAVFGGDPAARGADALKRRYPAACGLVSPGSAGILPAPGGDSRRHSKGRGWLSEPLTAISLTGSACTLRAVPAKLITRSGSESHPYLWNNAASRRAMNPFLPP